MKVSNNALNFLLAQYRAIFKRAYVKGLASAVLLTAGLAAAQAQAADLNNDSGSALEAEKAITIGSGGDFDKIQISGGFTNDWNADVTITSGAASSAGNAILGSGSDNVAITGTGSLTIAVTETTPSGNGLLIVGDGKSASLTLDKVDVQRGELQVADSGSNSSGTVSLVAGTITIGKTATSEEEATGRAAAAREAYLTVKADSDAGSTLGNDQSTITVNKTGQLTLTAASTKTATVNADNLTIGEGGLLLINGEGTSKIAAVDLNIEAGAFGVVAGSASGSFTGENATVAGNLLVNGTLDITTDSTSGTVTLAEGSNTVISKTVTVNKGTLEVQSGADLHATAGTAKIEIKNGGDANTNVTLKIDSSALESFLNSGDKYTAINEDGSLGAENGATGVAGQVTFSGGAANKLAVLHLTDTTEVDLSDFSFATSEVAGAIVAKDNTLIKGNDIRISNQLTSGSTTVAGGSTGKISIEATRLTLGDNNAAASDYGFKAAKVKDLIADTTTAVNLSGAVTLDVTVGSDPSTTIPADANGVFSGDFVLDDTTNGTLTVEHGHYTHDGSLTINGGKLVVTNSTTDKDIETYLTLDQVTLYYGNSSNSGSTIDVNGSGTGVATVLDISKANLEIGAGQGTASGSITVQSGGTLRTDSDNLNKILNKGTNSKGFAVTLNTGTLEVTEGLELDVAKLNTSAAEDKIYLNSTNGTNTILVNGELALTNISSALNYDKTEFTAEELTFEMASGQTGPAQLQSGTYTAWSGLDGNKP